MALPQLQREEIQKALRVRDRLDKWLDERGSNGKRPAAPSGGVEAVPACADPEYPGWVLHEPRNDSDIHPSQVHKCMKKLWFDCAGFAPEAEESIEPRLAADLRSRPRVAPHGPVATAGLVRGDRRSSTDEEVRDRPWPPSRPERQSLLFLCGGSPVDPGLCRRQSSIATSSPTCRRLGDVAVRMVHEYKTINSSGFTNLKKPEAGAQVAGDDLRGGLRHVPLVVLSST
jgi:hypothetical protein